MRPQFAKSKVKVIFAVAFTLIAILFLINFTTITTSDYIRQRSSISVVKEDAVTSAPKRMTFPIRSVSPSKLGHDFQLAFPPVWFDAYIKVYNEQMSRIASGKTPRVMLYKHDKSGWGNRLRELHYVFLMALFDKRLLFVTFQDLEFHYASPYGITMFQSQFPEGLLDDIWQQGIDEGFDDACRRIRAYQDTSKPLYDQDLVVYGASTSPDIAMYDNEIFMSWFQKVYGTTSRSVIYGMNLSMFLSQPRVTFLKEVLAAKKEMGWFDYDYHAGFQFRAFVDHYDTQLKMMEGWDKFLEEAENILIEFINRRKVKSIMLWFTSDDNNLYDYVEENVVRFRQLPGVEARLTKSPYPATHSTTDEPNTIKGPIKDAYMMGDMEYVDKLAQFHF